MSRLLHCGPPFGYRARRYRGAEYSWRYSPSKRVYGRGIVFELSEKLQSDPIALLQALGEKPGENSKSADERLAKLIEANRERILLPPAALLSKLACPGDSCSSSLLDILTVLAKSSGSLYLRNKAPNLHGIGRVRRVVVVVPPNWSQKAPKEQEKGAA